MHADITHVHTDITHVHTDMEGGRESCIIKTYMYIMNMYSPLQGLLELAHTTQPTYITIHMEGGQRSVDHITRRVDAFTHPSIISLAPPLASP